MTALLGDVEHGTVAAYRRCTADGGRACRECRAANAAYVAERRRSPRGYVAAGKVRSHIRLLMDDGLSQREIARRAGVADRTVQRIAAGEITTCTPENRAKILGVLPSYNPTRGCDTNHIVGIHPDEDEPDEVPDEPVFDDPLASLRLLLDDPEALAWKAEGECKADRLRIPVERAQLWFFPMRGESTSPAMTICARCPVWMPCLQFALDNNHDGVWGRSSGAARRKIVHLGLTVEELADAGMRDDPDLTIGEAIDRVLASREQVA